MFLCRYFDSFQLSRTHSIGSSVVLEFCFEIVFYTCKFRVSFGDEIFKFPMTLYTITDEILILYKARAKYLSPVEVVTLDSYICIL